MQIFALVSEGGEEVPEQELVPSLVWYNAECAATEREKIDGVAVNNEDFTTILQEHGSEQRKVAYLTNLAKIGTTVLLIYPTSLCQFAFPASGAKAGDGMLTHFSISWNWFEAGGVTFNGVRKNVVKHMIDLFNSTDLQTAYILGSVMLDRLQKGFHGTAAVSRFNTFMDIETLLLPSLPQMWVVTTTSPTPRRMARRPSSPCT